MRLKSSALHRFAGGKSSTYFTAGAGSMRFREAIPSSEISQLVVKLGTEVLKKACWPCDGQGQAVP
jgi:aconitase A